jgi:FAD:protein FMN transferase
VTGATATEAQVAFPCFGSRVAVSIFSDPDAEGTLIETRRLLESWHRQFTRFEPHSELSRLNSSPHRCVPASNMMCRFVAAGLEGAVRTGGLVDPTLGGEIESAGYRGDLRQPLPIDRTLGSPVVRRPARPSATASWREVHVDKNAGTVTRPPGVKLDCGGIAKGLFADVVGERLSEHEAFAVDCGGDLLIGGRGGSARAIRVDDPFGRGVLHEFAVVAAGVATSGIGRRSWRDGSGAVGHHILDPSTGLPAYTGIVQATALAPGAVEAEVLAKAALLSGPGRAEQWLPHGGVLVFEDGSCDVLAPAEVDAT